MLILCSNYAEIRVYKKQQQQTNKETKQKHTMIKLIVYSMIIVDRMRRLIGYCGTLCTGSDAGVAGACCTILDSGCQALVDTRGGYTLDWVTDTRGGHTRDWVTDTRGGCTLLDWVIDTRGGHTHTAGLGH